MQEKSKFQTPKIFVDFDSEKIRLREFGPRTKECYDKIAKYLIEKREFHFGKIELSNDVIKKILKDRDRGLSAIVISKKLKLELLAVLPFFTSQKNLINESILKCLANKKTRHSATRNSLKFSYDHRFDLLTVAWKHDCTQQELDILIYQFKHSHDMMLKYDPTRLILRKKTKILWYYQ